MEIRNAAYVEKANYNVMKSRSVKKKRALLLLVVLFAVVYYLARIAIFLAVISGTGGFEEEQSAQVENLVKFSFLGIGVLGLLMLPGVYLMKLWGFWGTIAVSAYTIAFDLWAFVSVQSSAGAGIIPAGVLMAYLLLTRKDFIKSQPTASSTTKT
jgi:hypothetical protein